MRHGLDDFWERMKLRYPQMQDFDVIRDQSHVHHTLVTILMFGTVGMLMAVGFRAPLAFIATGGLASGILGGLIGYVIREGWSRLCGDELRAYEIWDGILDVLLPVTVTLPWALTAYLGTVPWWSGMLLYGCAAIVAFLYTFGRPKGTLYYH